jgi:hypothetical protein
MAAAGTNDRRSGANRALSALRLSALLVTAALAGLAVVEAFPHHVKNAVNPDFVDNIVASSVVIFALRLAVFFAVVYVGVSVVGLIGGRRWLSQLGPFKASEPIARLDRNGGQLRGELEQAIDTAIDLDQRLAESAQSLTEAQADIERLLDRVDKMESDREGC